MLPPCVGARFINHVLSKPGTFVAEGNKTPAFHDLFFEFNFKGFPHVAAVATPDCVGDDGALC